ncbi:MAG: hypothetical protein HY072_06495, partial [Deltaproteobacteria bacterium]|nr:hypothetical protein [Deltaproteobacteria bacterium]
MKSDPRLPDAIRDNQNILALIHSSALSSDGTSLQMLSPVKETVKIAFERAVEYLDKIPKIEFLECHGSGTQIGDQIEMECAKEVYGEKNPIILGSIKISVTNEVKSYTQNTPWAAVNAMGLGGINGHVLLSGFDPAEWTPKEHKVSIVDIDNTKEAHLLFATHDELYKQETKLKQALSQNKEGLYKLQDLFRKERIYLKDLSLNYRLAFLFAGQSSAYKNMFLELAKNHPTYKMYLEWTDTFCKAKGIKE